MPANITCGLQLVLDGKVGEGLEYDFVTVQKTTGALQKNNEGLVQLDNLNLRGAANKICDDLGKKGAKNPDYMIIVKQLAERTEKAYFVTKEREAKALAMGRPVVFDITFDTPWNIACIDVLTRMYCEERKLFSGLPKKKDEDDDSDEDALAGVQLQVVSSSVYAYDPDKVVLHFNAAIQFQTAAGCDYQVIVDGQSYDIIEATQSSPDFFPGWVKLEIDGITIRKDPDIKHEVRVSYGQRQRVAPENRIAASDAVDSALKPFDSVKVENRVSDQYMQAARVVTATKLEVTLSQRIFMGTAEVEDFDVTFGEEKQPIKKIVQSETGEAPGLLTFHFHRGAEAGTRVEFRYTMDEDKKATETLAGDNGRMQSQRGLMIMIPMLAGNINVWKDFYRSYVEITDHPTPRFVTPRGISGHDELQYMELLKTSRAKDVMKKEALERRKAAEARKAAGIEEEADAGEKPWLKPCKEHYTESCPVCWDMEQSDGGDENGPTAAQNEAHLRERVIGEKFEGGGLSEHEFRVVHVEALLGNDSLRYTGNNGRMFFLTLMQALLEMKPTEHSKALLPYIEKERPPRIALADVLDFQPINRYDEGVQKEVGVGGAVEGDVINLVYANGSKMGWGDAIVKHDTFGDEIDATVFVDEVVTPWEEAGLVVGSVGMEHNMKKPGWGGKFEYLGAFAMRPGNPAVPQFTWDYDTDPDFSLLAVKVPGITFNDIDIQIEAEGRVVIFSTGSGSDEDDDDDPACRVYNAGWIMPIDRIVDASANPRPSWIKTKAEGLIRIKFKIAQEKFINTTHRGPLNNDKESLLPSEVFNLDTYLNPAEASMF